MFEDVDIVILDTSATTQKIPNTVMKDNISLWSETQNQAPYTYTLFSSQHLIKHCVNQQGHILISMHLWVVLLSFSHTQPDVQLYIAPVCPQAVNNLL